MKNERRTIRACLGRLAALALGAGLGLSAHAQSSVHVWPSATAISNGWVFSYDNGAWRPDVGRTYGPGSSGAVVVRDTVRLAQPGSGLVVQTARTVPWGNVAKAAAGVAGRALPWVSGALAVCALLQASGVDCPPGGNDAPFFDPGQPKQTVQGNEYRVGSSGPWYSTATQACQAAYTCSGSGYVNITYNSSTNHCRGQPDYSEVTCVGGGTYGSARDVGPAVDSRTATIDGGCPPTQHQASPAPFADGSCPSDARVIPTIPQLEAAIESRPVDRTSSPQVVDELVRQGQPVQAPGPGQVTGPSSVPGPSRTSQGPQGTETTQTDYPMSYGPDRATWGKVETVHHPDGTTTTTTESGPAAESDSDLCAKHPDIVACQKLGEAPSDQVPKKNAVLDLQAESVGLPSACPSPVTIEGVGTISYASACETATKLRPFVIVTGILAAMGMVLATLRQG